MSPFYLHDFRWPHHNFLRNLYHNAPALKNKKAQSHLSRAFNFKSGGDLISWALAHLLEIDPTEQSLDPVAFF
jgi:hypothetical protein